MTEVDANASLKQKKPHDTDYYCAYEKLVYIDRNGNINTETNPEFKKSKRMEEYTSNNLRQKINELNNAVSPLAKKELHCHLQFDGENLTSIPQLLCTEEEIQAYAQEDTLVAKHLECYSSAKEELKY